MPFRSVARTSNHDGDFPSAPLVLDVLRSGREERRAHFDALDQKAGLALGFAGVLVTRYEPPPVPPAQPDEELIGYIERGRRERKPKER